MGPGGAESGRARLLRGGRAENTGDTVVLLHGRGHAASIWFPCWPALAARHPLLALDLPGFGEAEVAAEAAGAGCRDAEQALRFFVDPIERQLLAERARGQDAGFALVGHSLGGLVALELACRGRLPIRRLALIDAMGLGPRMTRAARIFFRLHPERLARLLGARLFDRLGGAPRTPLGRRVAELERELLRVRSPSRRAAARAFDRLCPIVGPAFHRGQSLPALGAPVLLLWGERDGALPVSGAADACRRLPSGRLLTFPLGHSPHLESPEALSPPLLDFLAAGAR
jgi:pimeloyl-ACP methyl ester carboxylesterase